MKEDNSHTTRFSDSSLYDYICTKCGATDAAGDNRLYSRCPAERAKEVGNLFIRDDDATQLVFSVPPSSSLTFQSPDGKTAIIDFGGESITYKGDLTVEESAKMFFEAFGHILNKHR